MDLLSFKDERLEQAIRETGAKILVLDPLQAYIGEDADMNRTNEVRPAFRTLANVASRTHCAVVIGEYMNKMSDKKSLMLLLQLFSDSTLFREEPKKAIMKLKKEDKAAAVPNFTP